MKHPCASRSHCLAPPAQRHCCSAPLRSSPPDSRPGSGSSVSRSSVPGSLLRGSRVSPPRLALAVALLAATALPAQADVAITDELSFYGDVRAGYFHLRRKDRDDTIYTDSDWRIRVRPGLKWQPAENWIFAARLAGRFAHKQDGTRFTMDPYAPPLDHGEASFDELYAQYRNEQHTLRVGRFQVAHALIGVSPKSLDRND